MGNGAGKIFKIMQKTGNENSSTSLVTLTVSSLNPLLFKLDNKLTITEEFYLLYYEDNTTFTLNQQVKALVLNNNQLYLILNKPVLHSFPFDKIYPIGSIYMTINSTNPSTLFGGTWVEWGTGRVPVGIDTNDSDFNIVEKIGGSKYIQEHKHSFKVVKDSQTNSGGNLPKGNNSEGENEGWSSFYSTDDNNLAVGEVVGATTGSSGNLQPYITCYMWKRTA